MKRKYFPNIYPNVNYVKIGWISYNPTKLRKIYYLQKYVADMFFSEDLFCHSRPVLVDVQAYIVH